MGFNTIKLYSGLQSIFRYIPHILAVLSLTILIAFILIGRPDLSFKASPVLVPLIFISLLFIFTKRPVSVSEKTSIYLPIPQNLLWKIYLILMCICIVDLLLNERGLLNLILIFSLYAVIALQSLSRNINPGLILIELMITTSLLVLPQLFVSGYFFGDTDLLAHARWADMILNWGSVPEEIFGAYQFFYLYHIFIALGSALSGIAVNASLYIISTFAVVASIPFVYLIARYFTKSRHISILAAFFYSVMPMILSALLVPAPRVLATMAFFIVLYLMFCSRKFPKRAIILAIIVVMYMSIVHHAQHMLILAALLMICIGCIFFFRKLTIGNFVVLIVCILIPFVYQIYGYLLQIVGVVKGRLFNQLDTGAIGDSIISNMTIEIDISYLLSAASSAVLTVLIFAGLYYLLMKKLPAARIHVLIPFILILFIFFVPLVMDIFPTLTQAFQLYRFRMILTPIFAIAMGLGVGVILSYSVTHKHIRRVLCCSVVIILCMLLIFSSVIVTHTQDNKAQYDLGSQYYWENYFKTEDVSLFGIIDEYVDEDIAFYSNREYPRYFASNAAMEKYGAVYQKWGYLPPAAFLESSDLSDYHYILHPSGKYERIGLNMYDSRGDYVEAVYERVVYTETHEQFDGNVNPHNLIYENGESRLYNI